MRIAGERNPNAFARRIGLKRAENLYQIKRGNNRISRELAALIHAAIPEVSIAWLMTGEQITASQKLSQNENIIIDHILAHDYQFIEDETFIVLYIKKRSTLPASNTSWQ